MRYGGRCAVCADFCRSKNPLQVSCVGKHSFVIRGAALFHLSVFNEKVKNYFNQQGRSSLYIQYE